MKSILRYHVGDNEDVGVTSKFGGWCRWKDVEALQKELAGMRALTIAAVLLIPDDVTIGELATLRREAEEIVMGADKQTIAKLQDRVAALESDLRQAQFASKSPGAGITAVYGIKGDNDIRVIMQINRLNHLQGGGIEVEVRLP